MSARLFDTGILTSILLPNLAFSSSLVLPTYLLQRLQLPISTTSFWTAATLGNIFWLTISPRLDGSLGQALRRIPRSEWLLLGTLAGSATCLILEDLATNLSRGDQDFSRDALYTKRHGSSSWTTYLTDWGGKILAHSLITLPLLAPLRTSHPALKCPFEWTSTAQASAVTLWTVAQAISALSAMASDGISDLGLRDSIRHPQSLGLVLESIAYPLYLYSRDLFHPLFLLSPLTTYLTLRSKDSTAEHDDEDRLAIEDPYQCVKLHERWEVTNSFWPGVESLKRKWSWVVLVVGMGTALSMRYNRIGLRS